LHGDDTTVPALASKAKLGSAKTGTTHTGRCWVYVRDDRPFGGSLVCASDAHPHPRCAPPAAMFSYSRDRGGEHPRAHLAKWSGLLQADAYGGYNKLYAADRTPGPILEAGCWAVMPKSCSA
jgi:transposase